MHRGNWDDDEDAPTWDGLSNVVNSKIYDLLPFWKGKAMTKEAKNFYCTLSDD